MSAPIRCPHCGHVLLSIELPETPTPTPASTRTAGPDAPLLLRVAEAAQLLGVSRSAMYELVASGQVPMVRVGRSIRVVRAELGRWIERAMSTD